MTCSSSPHRWASDRTAWVRRVYVNQGQDDKKLKSDSYRSLYHEKEMTTVIGDIIKGGRSGHCRGKKTNKRSSQLELEASSLGTGNMGNRIQAVTLE